MARTRLSSEELTHQAALAGPRASRTHISRWRPAARTSIRLATLAQAISSTNPDGDEQDDERSTVHHRPAARASGRMRTVHPAFDAGNWRAMSGAIR